MNELLIKHKYKVGQVVYFMKDNEITKGIVNRIEISVHAGGIGDGSISEKIAKGIMILTKKYPFDINIIYCLDRITKRNTYGGTPHIYNECDVYESQKDLIQSLSLQ